MVTEAFLPLLLKAKETGQKALVVNISSALGSVTHAWKVGDEIGGIPNGQFWHAYNMSKVSFGARSPDEGSSLERFLTFRCSARDLEIHLGALELLIEL